VLAASLKSVSSQRLIETISAVISEQPQKSESGDLVRLQFFQKTGEMISERPLLGHGIGSWRQQYPIRAEGLMTAQMSTPHNDYLLYTAELGLVGLITLLAIFFSLIRAAIKAPFKQGNLLLMTSVAIAIGSMFNAILRDWRFGVPFMLLLAIAYRESQQEPTEVD
jgi:O-antigen ligase